MFVCNNLFICLLDICIYLSIYHLSVCLSIRLSIYSNLSKQPIVYLSICYRYFINHFLKIPSPSNIMFISHLFCFIFRYLSFIEFYLDIHLIIYWQSDIVICFLWPICLLIYLECFILFYFITFLFYDYRVIILILFHFLI